AGLHRQVDEGGQFGHVAVRLDQAVEELHRVRGGVADAAYAGDLRDRADQVGEVGGAGVGLVAIQQAAVGVDVLAEQVDFLDALPGELGDLDQHVLERPAHFLAARIGHHAEAAVLAAAFHHRYERRRAFGARLGHAVELLDLGEADVDLRAAGLALGLDQLGQAVKRRRAEPQVDVGRALEDGLALLAGHAAADADDDFVVLLLELLPAAELAEHLLLRLLADRAGVDQDDVGLALVVG